jgi:ABC-type bacteriocin/lantibiotic exporter with double-glycine peptidase domain
MFARSRPQGGDVRYDGSSINGADPDALHKRIGLVTQDTQFFPGTIQIVAGQRFKPTAC